MRGFVIFVLGILVGSCGLAAFHVVRSELTVDGPEGTASIPPEPAEHSTRTVAGTPHGRRAVLALGTIEPRDGIVLVASPLIGYQIDTVHVREGQQVSAGELLITLDATHPQGELGLAQTQLQEAEERQQTEFTLAEQRLRTADLAYQQAMEGGELELRAQRARVAAVAARKRQAERDLERLEELRRVRESLASEQQLEQQRVMAESAVAELSAAELSLQGFEQSLAFQRKTAEAELDGARTARDLAARSTGLETLRQRLELARLRLAQTEVRSPSAGTVLTLATRTGELVSQQPLLQMADLTSLVCLAEVDAGDVPLLQTSHPAKIRFRGWPEGTITGQLERIGSVVAESRLRPLDPRRPVDRHVARGVVGLETLPTAGGLASDGTDVMAAWVGLQVEVEFPLMTEEQSSTAGEL
jgi:HlyD family secretion protein